MTSLDHRIRLAVRRVRKPRAPQRHAPFERLSLSARDGVRLNMLRVRPSGSSSRGAVMLLHGLSSSAATFAFPQRSLAHSLAAAGYDCFVPELRGAGESEAPKRGWDVHDYLEHDLPALIDGIRAQSDHERVHWIGHSMGGVLLMFYGITHPSAPIKSGVTIGSALDYTQGESGFQRLLFLRPYLERLRISVPYHLFQGALSRASGSRLVAPLQAFNVCIDNIEPEILRQVHASCFGPISIPLLVSLAATFEPRGFRSRDGSLYYLEEAARFTYPLMLMGGSADLQCPEAAVVATHERLGSTRRELVLLGKKHGHAQDYGHFDLVIGARAEQEVWPRLRTWLAEHN